jgi:hypothetical protein
MRPSRDFWHNAAKRRVPRNLAVDHRRQDLGCVTAKANNRSCGLVTAGFNA